MKSRSELTILLTSLCLTIWAPVTVAGELNCAGCSNLPHAGDPSSQIITDKALAQVLVVGLSVFDLREASELTIYFPKVADHYMSIDEGRLINGERQWHNVIENFAKSKMTLLLPEDFQKVDTRGPSDEYDRPISETDARDVDWLLKAKEVDDSAELQTGWAKAELRVTNGELATCSLIPDVNYREVCRMRNLLGKEQFYRGLADSMVISSEVEKVSDMPLIEIECNEVCRQNINMLTLENCSVSNLEACAQRGDRYYKYVFDVRIRNTPPPRRQPAPVSLRSMRSFHGHGLEELFNNSERDWNVISSDCYRNRNRWWCSHCGGQQPPCASYFRSYSESESTTGQVSEPSYEDASACPLVGYP